MHITGTTRTRIGEGVTIAGMSVDINAQPITFKGTSNAYAKAINPILLGVAVAFADAIVVINSTVENLIGLSLGRERTPTHSTRITGYRGVDVTATNPDLIDRAPRRASSRWR